MKEEKKLSFFKELSMSVKDFDQYTEFAERGMVKTAIYVAKLIAIFAIIATILYMFDFVLEVNMLKTYIENEISNVEYKDGILEVANNEEIIIENENIVFGKIIVNTSDVDIEKQIEYNDLIKNEVLSGIIILKDEVLLKMPNSTGIVSYNYYDVFDGETQLNKEDILQQFDLGNMFIIYIVSTVMMFSYMFIIFFVDITINIILLALMGFFTSILLRVKIKYNSLCCMAAHALTLPIILNILYIIINKITGFTIDYFNIMYIAIAYIYIITAILLIKADMIKKGKELAKVIEEQEKVRLEIEQKEKEEEEKRQEEQRRKEREKQKKKEKEKNKKEEKGKIGTQPQGENG